jgi:hypothetical protein
MTTTTREELQQAQKIISGTTTEMAKTMPRVSVGETRV